MIVHSQDPPVCWFDDTNRLMVTNFVTDDEVTFAHRTDAAFEAWMADLAASYEAAKLLRSKTQRYAHRLPLDAT